MDIVTGVMKLCNLLLSPPTLCNSTHSHTHTMKGEQITCWRENQDTLPSGPGSFHLYPPSFLPPSLGENNNGTSAAFEGRLDGTDSYGLGGVSGQVGVSPQLLEQLSVEGGRLGLSCYLSPEGPWGKGGVGGVTLSRPHYLYCTASHSHHWEWRANAWLDFWLVVGLRIVPSNNELNGNRPKDIS